MTRRGKHIAPSTSAVCVMTMGCDTTVLRATDTTMTSMCARLSSLKRSLPRTPSNRLASEASTAAAEAGTWVTLAPAVTPLMVDTAGTGRNDARSNSAMRL